MAFEPLSMDEPTNAEPSGRAPLSQDAKMLGIGVYGGLLVVGFFFGIVTGYERPKTVVVTKAAPKEKESPKETPKPVVVPSKVPPKTELNPEPKVEPTTPEPKMEPKTEPKVEPKPEVKPEPKPEPKKEEVALKAVSFQKDVLPILRSYCFNCHGAAGKPKGDVDLTSLAKITAKGAPDILTAGDPKKSAIYTTVEGQTMPPDGKRPGKGETDVIRNWILGGAKPRRRRPG